MAQMSVDIPGIPLPTDSVPTDTVAADTVPPRWGVLLETPRPVTEVKEPDTTMSWVAGVLLLSFVIVALRFKNNGKYIVSLWNDMTQVRERRNIFDDTVRETSIVVLLNILWILVVSLLAGSLLLIPEVADSERFAIIGHFTTPAPTTLPMLILKGTLPAVALYTIMMFIGYWTVGNVFSDSGHTRMWIRGFAATNSLESIFLFPIALLDICYPEIAPELLIIAGILFITGKIFFFYKGFRIFFSQGSSWVLFLYYLCSLEIVPLVLLFVGAQIFSHLL